MEHITIAAVQPHLRAGGTNPVSSAQHVINLMKKASETEDIDLFVLPELCPLGYSDDTFDMLTDHHTTNKVIDEIDHLMCNCAKDLSCCICYGTIGIDCISSANKPTIRQKVVDKDGKVMCSYDKIHLCDYGDCAETRCFQPGHNPISFQVKGFSIGIIICADIRNPTLSRALARKPHNCDVIVQPAAFSRDISFRTWNSFRETRAVENSVYFVAVNYAGAYYGSSSIIEPWVDENHEPDTLGIEEGVLVKNIRRDVLEKVRAEFPYHRQVLKES